MNFRFTFVKYFLFYAIEHLLFSTNTEDKSSNFCLNDDTNLKTKRKNALIYKQKLYTDHDYAFIKFFF